MGIGPIPFTAIAEYARIFNVEDFDEFLYIIRVMDNQFVKSQNARKQETSNRNSNKANR